MISCEDILSDEESDSHLEPEVQYVDSDKANSDIEVELYSRIYFTEDLNATASTQNTAKDNSYIFDVSPVKSIDLLSKSETELSCDGGLKQGTTETMKLNHFESSTPITSVKNNLIVKKKNKTAKDKVKSCKVKTGKRKVAVGSKLKPSKSSEDSGCFEAVTCSDNPDGVETDESVVILDSYDLVTKLESREVILLDSSPTSDDVSLGGNSASPELSDSDDSSKFSLSTGSVKNTSGDLWHIDHEDRYSFIRKQKRYHEKHSSICNNCKKRGHLSKDCKEPRNTRCYICGQDHVIALCHKIMCGRCLEFGHNSRKCRFRAYQMSCNLCKMRGHLMHNCPDLWRRYHLTTTPDGIVKGSKGSSQGQGMKKYCYNCGHEGHYGHECLRPRMLPDTFPTWPYVISYKHPSRHFKKPKQMFMGESSNSSKHYDSHSRHKHDKKHRSRAGEIRSLLSEKYSDSCKKSKNKEKTDWKKFREMKRNPLKGNDFPRSTVVLHEEGYKNQKKRKRDFDRLFAFNRKKQKLNTTV